MTLGRWLLLAAWCGFMASASFVLFVGAVIGDCLDVPACSAAKNLRGMTILIGMPTLWAIGCVLLYRRWSQD